MELKPSPEFASFAARGALKQGQWMPCPKCGNDKTRYSTPGMNALSGFVLGAILAFVAGIFVPGLLLPALALAIGLPVGMYLLAKGAKPYVCPRCALRWTFEEAMQWAQQDMPAEPAAKP